MGNIFLNPGFETGKLSPGWFGGMTVNNQHNHSGNCAAFGSNQWMQQNFPTPIPAANITELSFWFDFAAGDSGSTGYINILYSDSTFTQVAITPATVYTKLNVTASITSGKLVSGVYVFVNVNNPCWFDDFVCTVPGASAPVGCAGAGAAMNVRAMMFFWLISAITESRRNLSDFELSEQIGRKLAYSA
jgi:hypothetical protein